MLSVGNLFLGTLRAFNSVIIFLNLEKTFLLSSCCSNHQAKKQGSAVLDKLRTATLSHQTQTCFRVFIIFLMLPFSLSLG